MGLKRETGLLESGVQDNEKFKIKFTKISFACFYSAIHLGKTADTSSILRLIKWLWTMSQSKSIEKYLIFYRPC